MASRFKLALNGAFTNNQLGESVYVCGIYAGNGGLGGDLPRI